MPPTNPSSPAPLAWAALAFFGASAVMFTAVPTLLEQQGKSEAALIQAALAKSRSAIQKGHGAGPYSPLSLQPFEKPGFIAPHYPLRKGVMAQRSSIELEAREDGKGFDFIVRTNQHACQALVATLKAPVFIDGQGEKSGECYPWSIMRIRG